MLSAKNEGSYLKIIWVLSILIPIVIAILMYTPSKFSVESGWVSFLPHLNGILNSATTVALIAGYFFIRQKQVAYHKVCMLVAFSLGSLFLVSYVVYHASAPSTIFGDTNGNGILEELEAMSLGNLRVLYLIILLSHILLAIIVVPFVLFALYYAINKKFEKHKKIVKYTLPIWLYVSVTGVIVYLMISPYYQ